jgi:hypothetical protein
VTKRRACAARNSSIIRSTRDWRSTESSRSIGMSELYPGADRIACPGLNTGLLPRDRVSGLSLALGRETCQRHWQRSHTKNRVIDVRSVIVAPGALQRGHPLPDIGATFVLPAFMVASDR